MKVFVIFVGLLALAYSQCELEGTFANEATTITFGTAVGDWIPAISTPGDNDAYFLTFKQATDIRWEIQDHASTEEEWDCEGHIGQYNLKFNTDCTEITLTRISDVCEERAAFFEEPLMMDEGEDGEDEEEMGCMDASATLEGEFMESESQPRLSEDGVTFTFGDGGFVVISVADRAAIFQQWVSVENGEAVQIIDLASIPEGFACDSRYKGSYWASWDDGCALQLCGELDSCTARGELLHGIALNEWEGDECETETAPEPEYNFAADDCSDGRTWEKHPWDCIDQGTGGQCFFCRGIANGETISMCLQREGGGCNQIFESDAAEAFCNLEFECPASTVAASLFFVISSVLALSFLF